jgi:RNA polymerase sigma-70 factor (ECF subfamily)
MDFDEVGKTLGRTPAATRKLASRARQRLRQEAPRFSATSPDVERVMSIIENAVQSGDLSELKNLLAADAELISDGGGKMLAALNIIRGRDAVARFIFGLGRKPGNEHLHPIIARFNDAAGIILASDRGTDSVITFDFDSVGRIIAIYLVRNPDKLDHLPTSASRMITPPSGRDTP